MKFVKYFILLFCLILCSTDQQILASDNFAKYTLARDDLQHSALIRLSDIFTLIDEWDVYSVDGYTWQGIANSLDIYHQQNWTILVDGHRIDAKQFDITNINILPFSTNEIDSIEVFPIPVLVEDSFSEKGIIHIHTRQIEPGVTIQGQFSAGNQTGDPGPYRYTEFWSENVDRIAADESYWLSHRGKVGFVGAGYYTQVYYPTDPLIVDRNREIYPYRNPAIKTYSYNMRAGLSNIFSRPTITTTHSQIDNFYFFKPLGREIPVVNQFFSIGLIGEEEFSPKTSMGYKIRYSGNSIRKRENAYDIDFDWSSNSLYATLIGKYRFSRLHIKFGLAFEQTEVTTDYELTQTVINNGIIFGSIKLDNKSGPQFKIDSEIRFNDEETGIKIAATNLWSVRKDQRIIANISYSQTMSNIENNLWYWSERGYDFLRDQGEDYTIEGRLQPARQWSFDFYWFRDEDIFPSFKAGILYRGFLRKNWEQQPFVYDSISKTVSGPVSIKTNQNGQMGGFYLKLRYNHLSFFEHQFYYRYATTIGATGLFSRIRDEIPENLLIYRITYRPVPNFSIWAMCKYISPTFWHDFQDIDQQSQGIYSARVSEVLLIDVAINKWLWNRQIKVDLILRNILNKKNISYPIGASPNLRFYVQAELYFNFW